MNFNDLIEEILKNYNYDIDIETLKSYYRLLYCDIKYFLTQGLVYVKINFKSVRRLRIEISEESPSPTGQNSG